VVQSPPATIGGPATYGVHWVQLAGHAPQVEVAELTKYPVEHVLQVAAPKQVPQFGVQAVQVFEAKNNPAEQVVQVAKPPAQFAQPVTEQAVQRFVAATPVLSPKPALQKPGSQKPAPAVAHCPQLEAHALHVTVRVTAVITFTYPVIQFVQPRALHDPAIQTCVFAAAAPAVNAHKGLAQDIQAPASK